MSHIGDNSCDRLSLVYLVGELCDMSPRLPWYCKDCLKLRDEGIAASSGVIVVPIKVEPNSAAAAEVPVTPAKPTSTVHAEVRFLRCLQRNWR